MFLSFILQSNLFYEFEVLLLPHRATVHACTHILLHVCHNKRINLFAITNLVIVSFVSSRCISCLRAERRHHCCRRRVMLCTMNINTAHLRHHGRLHKCSLVLRRLSLCTPGRIVPSPRFRGCTDIVAVLNIHNFCCACLNSFLSGFRR